MVGKWGQAALSTLPCTRCGYPCTNSPCLSCAAIRCEPCFQYAAPCCNDMRHDDGRIPDMMHRPKVITERKSNPHLKTIQCTDGKCLTATKVSVYEDRPTVIGDYRFCPKCGGQAEVGDYYTLQEFYQMLASNFMVPVEIVSMAYPEWDKTKYGRFRSFLRAYIKEALNET